MRLMRLKFIFVFLFSLMLSGIQAQQINEAMVTTGGNASGSGGSVSYSVGQVVYSTYTGTSGSSLQGIQQPFEISIITSVEAAGDINRLVLAYPNPASDYLILKADNSEMSDLSYQLLDISGNLLENKKMADNETKIVFSNFAPATYLIKVTDGKKEVKTFKIIKN